MFKTERGRSTAFRTMFKKSNFSTGTGQASLRRSSEDGGCGDIWSLRLYESSDHPLSPEYRKLPRRKYIQNSKPEGSAKCFSDFVCCKMHFIKRARQSRWHGLSWYLVCVGLSWEDSRERGDMVHFGAPCLCAKYSKPSNQPSAILLRVNMIDSKRLLFSSLVTIWRSTVHFLVHRLIKVTRLENLYMLRWRWRLCGLCACGVRVFNIQSNRQTVPPLPTNTLTKKMMMVRMMIIRVKPLTEYPSVQ